MTITILSAQGKTTPASARADGEHLWLSPADVEAATDWSTKPEGLCRGSVCVPVPPADRQALEREDAVNLAAIWRRMNGPVAASERRDVWVLGEAAGDRTAVLESLEAPDFALPDLDGRMNRLFDHRGGKVLLTTWASW